MEKLNEYLKLLTWALRPKKKKFFSDSPNVTAPKLAHVDQRASVQDVAKPAPPAQSQPQDPNQILEASDGSDDDDDIINMLPLAQGGPGMLKITRDM